MRKALEFPRIDEGKLDAVEALIAAIADKEPGTAGAELEDLAALTGKVHTDVEFAEYWSWTDLDTLARLTLTPEPPCIPDLSREELVELVEIIQHCSVTGREWAMRYYTALLRRSHHHQGCARGRAGRGQGQAGEQGGVGQTAAEAVRAGALMLLRLIDPTDRNQEHSEHRKRAFKQ